MNKQIWLKGIIGYDERGNRQGLNSSTVKKEKVSFI